ncbi:Protein of unknown function [Cotesia congregata]|uniref:Uncharacterized protein n=1 Tax=Cotesia congregata TaxID=51543 RepID=A0A8J2HBG6_COTCN|nr:Protein of unknown function [Cotesia congregata]
MTRSSAFADSENDDLETEISDGNNCSQSTSKEPQETSGDSGQPTKLSEKASELLGVSKRQLKDQSFNFHPELVACWNEILESGLDTKVKKAFEENYPDKGNCSLKAPELNPELIPLLHKTARNKHLASNQDLCGRGLVALGKSLCAIFNDNNEPIEKDLLLEWLCDSSQIFCELMFQLTKTRKYQVYSYVDEKRKSVLVDSKTDKFLFGEDLGKRIKAAAMVEKVGLSLKSTPDKVNAAKSSQYLNWKSSTVTPRGQQQSSYNPKAPNKFSRSNRTSVPQTPVRSSTRSQTRQNQQNNVPSK